MKLITTVTIMAFTSIDAAAKFNKKKKIILKNKYVVNQLSPYSITVVGRKNYIGLRKIVLMAGWKVIPKSRVSYDYLLN